MERRSQFREQGEGAEDDNVERAVTDGDEIGIDFGAVAPVAWWPRAPGTQPEDDAGKLVTRDMCDGAETGFLKKRKTRALEAMTTTAATMKSVFLSKKKKPFFFCFQFHFFAGVGIHSQNECFFFYVSQKRFTLPHFLRRKSSQKARGGSLAHSRKDAATSVAFDDAPSSPRHLFFPPPAPPARGLRLFPPGHPRGHAHPDLLGPRAQSGGSQSGDEVARSRTCRWSLIDDARRLRRRTPQLAPPAL